MGRLGISPDGRLHNPRYQVPEYKAFQGGGGDVVKKDTLEELMDGQNGDGFKQVISNTQEMELCKSIAPTDGSRRKIILHFVRHAEVSLYTYKV